MNAPDPTPSPATASSGTPGDTTGTPGADERQWAMFSHLSALLGGFVTTGWGGGVGFFIGPLIIWLVKKDTMPFVADQAKEALNFAITISLACLALLILTLVSLGLGALLTVPAMIVVGLGAVVLVVVAAVKANEGVAYRYPFALRLVR